MCRVLWLYNCVDNRNIHGILYYFAAINSARKSSYARHTNTKCTSLSIHVLQKGQKNAVVNLVLSWLCLFGSVTANPIRKLARVLRLDQFWHCNQLTIAYMFEQIQGLTELLGFPIQIQIYTNPGEHWWPNLFNPFHPTSRAYYTLFLVSCFHSLLLFSTNIVTHTYSNLKTLNIFQCLQKPYHSEYTPVCDQV